MLDVGLADVDDEVVGEHELGQRVRSVPVGRPVGLAVETVPEGEVGIQPRPVGALVAVRELERVFHVVEIADLEVAIDGIKLLRRQHHVLHLGPADTLDPDVEPAAGQRLGDHPDQLHASEQLRAVDLDHEGEDVLSVHVDGAGVGKGELSRRDRLQRRRCVHDERIPARPGEDANAVTGAALLVVHAEADDVARRRRQRAFLSVGTVACGGIGEHAVERELLLTDGERCRIGRCPRA